MTDHREEDWDDPKWMVGRSDDIIRCTICYATGDDVWGIEGYQLPLCLSCRIRWRAYHGKPAYDE